jgi:hypothetical protein
MTVNTPEWLQDESLAHPGRPSFPSNCRRLIQFEALTITSTGRKNEYRRIGFADIHDRYFFVDTKDVKVDLV